jgi:hypothetical protein
LEDFVGIIIVIVLVFVNPHYLTVPGFNDSLGQKLEKMEAIDRRAHQEQG